MALKRTCPACGHELCRRDLVWTGIWTWSGFQCTQCGTVSIRRPRRGLSKAGWAALVLATLTVPAALTAIAVAEHHPALSLALCGVLLMAPLAVLILYRYSGELAPLGHVGPPHKGIVIAVLAWAALSVVGFFVGAWALSTNWAFAARMALTAVICSAITLGLVCLFSRGAGPAAADSGPDRE